MRAEDIRYQAEAFIAWADRLGDAWGPAFQRRADSKGFSARDGGTSGARSRTSWRKKHGPASSPGRGRRFREAVSAQIGRERLGALVPR